MDEGLTHLFSKKAGRTSLETKVIGKKIYAYDLVTSTNDMANFFARDDEPEGTVIFAKGQTQGRGRPGKAWVSPYAQGLYFSFILRPDLAPHQAQRVTLMTALAMAQALREIPIEDVSIRWPNDILVGDKKVCGILTEMNLEGDRIHYLVVGVGVNVNTKISALPPTATSLKEAAGREFDIADLSHIIMKKIDENYEVLRQHRFFDIIRLVKEHSGLILGGRVRLSWEDKEIEGYAVDFDEDGGLVIRRDNGLLQKVASGHIVKIG